MVKTTVFKEAEKLGIKNKRILCLSGRAVLAWYRENAPSLIGSEPSTEIVGGKETTFNVASYPIKEAGRIQLLIQKTKKQGRGYKGKNNNRWNKRERA